MKDKTVNSIPKKFGRYRVEKALGQGGMGAVYLAHDTQLDRKVAIKTPKFTENSSPVLMQRFYREARSAATLQHPNICPIYDVGEIGGIHYISMAFIEGRPLSDSMRSKTFPPVANIIRVVRKVALALHEAHAHGLVHRDLKPANIMIDQRGEPIVMDFGLARQFGTDAPDDIVEAGANRTAPAQMQKVEARLTMEGTIVGSPGYMSPEQLYGDNAKIGPPSDVYALGVLLFELLTRQLPFPGDGTLMSIVNAVISDPTPNASTVRSEIEPRFAKVCQKAMAKKMDDRYESMQSLAVALTQALKSGGDQKNAAKSDTSSNDAISPELVRTKEQHELARSLYQDGQYAAAASIMEKMVAGPKKEKNQYLEWAKEKLPQAREKAVEALTETSNTDDLWGEGVSSSTAPVKKRRKQKTRFRRRLTQWKRKSGLPTWAFRIAMVSVGVITFLLGAAVVNSVMAMLSQYSSTVESDAPVTTPEAQVTVTDASIAESVHTDQETDSERNTETAALFALERLMRFDTDDDGNISKSELQGQRISKGGPLRRVVDNFDNFDLVPRDGVLDANEIENLADILSTRANPGNRGARRPQP